MNHQKFRPLVSFLCLLTVLLFASECTTRSKRASLIMELHEWEATKYGIENCQFLGTAGGWSGWGGSTESVGVNNAKNQALDKAAALGATHCVWTEINTGFVITVRGKAYKCEQGKGIYSKGVYGHGELPPTVLQPSKIPNAARQRETERVAVKTLSSEPKEKLAVMDLKAKHGVKKSLAEGLSVVVRDEIHGLGNYEVLSKDDVEVIAERTAIRQSLGCDETQCLIDIGRSLGTKFMVAGAISKFGTTYNLSLRLIDTEGKDAGVKRRINRNCKCAEDELIDTAKAVASLLLKD